MAVTLNELRILTLRKIDEAYDSGVAEVSDGSGGILRINTTTWATGTDAYLTTLSTLTDLLNEAQNFLCRTAFVLEGTASVTWTANAEKFVLSAFTPGSTQGDLWAVETLQWNTTVLPFISRECLSRELGPSFRFASAGTPTYWYQANDTIHLYVKPSAQQTVTVSGLVLPVRLAESGTGTTTSASFMEDDALRAILPTAAALILVRRKATDPSLATRVADLENEFMGHWNRLRSNVPSSYRNGFMSMVPADLVRK